jgi:hypothetical protein
MAHFANVVVLVLCSLTAPSCQVKNTARYLSSFANEQILMVNVTMPPRCECISQ